MGDGILGAGRNLRILPERRGVPGRDPRTPSGSREIPSGLLQPESRLGPESDFGRTERGPLRPSPRREKRERKRKSSPTPFRAPGRERVGPRRGERLDRRRPTHDQGEPRRHLGGRDRASTSLAPGQAQTSRPRGLARANGETRRFPHARMASSHGREAAIPPSAEGQTQEGRPGGFPTP